MSVNNGWITAGGRLTPFTLDGDGEVFSYDSSDEGFAQFMGADSADLDLQALFGASGAADDANLALLSQIIP